MKIITRIKGGLGNQLYCYAAARRIAIINNVELVIDHTTGFKRDYQYKRKYMLDNFNILSRKATKNERLEPFERVRRGLFKKLEKNKKFHTRRYIEQEFPNFDERLLNLKIVNTTYIDGLWQSMKYFEDIEDIVREDLTMKPPLDEVNLLLSKQMQSCLSVAVHIRWFSDTISVSESNVSNKYYVKSIEKMENMLDSPHYYVFSDDPKAAKEKLDFPLDRVTFVSHNSDDDTAIWDFWLMTQCKHFVIANSTFSWWAAWLANSLEEKIVIFPKLSKSSNITWHWDYCGQMPTSWHPVIL